MSTARRLRTLASIAGVAGAYFLAGRLGLRLALVNPSATAIWPPSGIAIAACLMFGVRVWPGVALGAFLVNLTTAGTIATSMAIATGNTLEALLATFLIRHFASGRRVFDQPSDVFRFAGSALLSTAVAATFGVATLRLGHLAAASQAGAIWLTWWLGDAAGALVVAPFLVLWSRMPELRWRAHRILEAGAMGFLAVAVGWYVFRGPLQPYPLQFLIVPVLLWSAFRFTQREASTCVLLLATVATISTSERMGPFARFPRNESLLLLQAFLATISTTILAVSATVSERRRFVTSIRSLNDALEQRVVERTERLAAANRSLRELVHARAAVTEELRISEARLREAQGVARVGSWEWDIVRDTLWWSDGLFAIYGVAPDRFGGGYQDFLERVHPEDRERVERVVEEAMRERHGFSFEHRIVRPDGAVLTLHGRGRLVCDEAGTPLRMVGIGQDITERKRAEEEREHLIREQSARREAEEANRLKDEFLATLSHELRNPLNAIVGWARLLRDGRLDPPTTARAVEAINRSADLQSQLILDLLDLSRITSRRVEIHRRPLDAAALIEGVVETLRPAARARGVTLVPRSEGPPPAVLADPERLQQVLSNLASNAIRFAPEGGTVTITLARAGEAAALRVADDGPGIDPELLPRIFDPFRKGRSPAGRPHEGLGLGLAIVKQLTELQGGRVSAANAEGGTGAVFTVLLPMVPARLDDAAPHVNGPGVDAMRDPAPAAGSLRGIRVLVVEDAPDSRDLLIAVLGRHGAEVTAAASCAEALQAFAAAPPDVLVSDIEMEGGSGYDLIARIRSLPEERGGSVPAIALTAYAGAEHARCALDRGYQVHIAKPFDRGDLVARIESLARPGDWRRPTSGSKGAGDGPPETVRPAPAG